MTADQPVTGRQQMTGEQRVRRGDVLRLEIGPVANGGHCVARHEGRVVFVRHTLPGELVDARITEAGRKDGFWRADAVAILRASPDRVAPRCPVSGPGGCGGCDFQHVEVAAQRRLKADVVVDLMARMAGLDVAGLVVEHVPTGGPAEREGLDWRTRVRFTVDARGRAGFHRHRSHQLVPVTSCPIAHPKVDALGIGDRTWLGLESVEAVTPAAGDERLVVADSAGPATKARLPRLPAATGVAVRDNAGLRRVSGRTWLEEEVSVDGEVRRFRVSGTGFWQVHPGAPAALLDAVLAAADPRPGERALDLYAGAGLFSAGLASRVGPSGSVLAVESGRRAVADARRSLHDVPQVELVEAMVEDAVLAPGLSADVIVLDPPRAGAGPEVIRVICAMAPRVVVYVSCDPATLARDLKAAAGAGYRLTSLRALDLFPTTHHVECVAVLEPDPPR